MKKMIRGIVSAAVLTASLMLASCGGAEPDNSGVTTLVMAETNSLDGIAGMTDLKFKEEVESRSGGTIIIDIQANGVLGSDSDVLDTMFGGGGTIDMSRMTAYSLMDYGDKKSALLSMPYTFVSREHFWKFAESDLAQEFLLSSSDGNGVRGLFYAEEGFRNFFTTKEITDIESFRGLKIRVSNDRIMNRLVESLGASPTVVSFGELYSALQTGVVDGAEQPVANYRSNGFHEVAPYYILDGHTLGNMEYVIADTTWEKLTEEQRQILLDSGKAAAEYNRSISEDKEREVLESLREAGINIIEVEDKTPWQNAVRSVVEENLNGLDDIYDQIIAMQY